MQKRANKWLANSWPEARREAIEKAYARLGKDPDFRLLVEDLARYAGLRNTSFMVGRPDQMAFNEGQRDFVFHIIEMAGMDLVIQPKPFVAPSQPETRKE